jgi:outer membrane protein
MDTLRRNGLVDLLLVLTLALMVGFSAVPGARAEQGDWLVRLRAIVVDPDDSSSTVRSEGAPIAGSGVAVDDDTVPELDITYMLRDRWGLELILASSQHDVSGTGSLAGVGKILEARTLPPSLLLQYHFAPEAKVRPYVGLGLNFTLFFDEEATSSFEAVAGGPTQVDLDSSMGPAAQVGLDIGVSEKWFINLDLKYLDIDTTATLDTPGPLGTLSVDVDVKPYVFGFGVGRSF